VVAGDEPVAQALEMLEREALADAAEVLAEIGDHARPRYERSRAGTARVRNKPAQRV
jgi:hypothetical protein